MKKSKLKLEKFRVSKLSDSKAFFGGGSNDCVDDGTKDKPEKPKCVRLSSEFEQAN